jgi:hypothetical protein
MQAKVDMRKRTNADCPDNVELRQIQLPAERHWRLKTTSFLTKIGEQQAGR